ncbi:MAG TPA: hypothetical protein VF301_07475 [Ginsengibacter sp.]
MKKEFSARNRSSKLISNIAAKFKSRIFEFLLVFLAVFLGFWADSWREKLFEKERERQFMNSMYHDLKSDINDFNLNIEKSNDVIYSMHQIVSLLNSSSRYDSALNIYRYARSITLNSPFYQPNQRTYEQMKSSGELRLIKDNSVSDSITGYYNSLVWILTQNDYIHERLGDYMGGAENIFDGNVFLLILERKQDSELIKALPKEKYLTKDKLLFNKLFIRTQYFS